MVVYMDLLGNWAKGSLTGLTDSVAISVAIRVSQRVWGL